MTEMTEKTLIVAYGNRDREDDGAGWHILADLAQILGLDAPEYPGDSAKTSNGKYTLLYMYQLLPEMAEDLISFQKVLFLDAHNSTQMPEMVFEPVTPTLENSAFTHHLSSAHLLSISETLFGRHPDAWILSVRGYSFQFSRGLSTETSKLVQEASKLLKRELAIGKEIVNKAPGANSAMEPFKNETVWNYYKGENSLAKIEEAVVVEHQCELIINGASWLTFICSPSDLDALAAGFLWNENIISDLSEIKSLEVSENCSRVEVILTHPSQKPKNFHRTSTGMELDHKRKLPNITSELVLSAAEVVSLYQEFMDRQTLHENIGGFHSAGLSDGKATPILMEDLGRHNCVDKIAGRYLTQGKPFRVQAILLSGRVSSEMIFKSLTLQSPFIISRTSPTTLSIDVAQKVGITLIGYLRPGKFKIYTHPERIII